MKFTQLLYGKNMKIKHASVFSVFATGIFSHFSTLDVSERGSSPEWLAQSPRRSSRGGSLVAAQPLKP